MIKSSKSPTLPDNFLMVSEFVSKTINVCKKTLPTARIVPMMHFFSLKILFFDNLFLLRPHSYKSAVNLNTFAWFFGCVPKRSEGNKSFGCCRKMSSSMCFLDNASLLENEHFLEEVLTLDAAASGAYS